jgi:hypothetical protein
MREIGERQRDDQHAAEDQGSIRHLTPLECARLKNF